jgi:hypothetical protein
MGDSHRQRWPVHLCQLLSELDETRSAITVRLSEMSAIVEQLPTLDVYKQTARTNAHIASSNGDQALVEKLLTEADSYQSQIELLWQSFTAFRLQVVECARKLRLLADRLPLDNATTYRNEIERLSSLWEFSRGESFDCGALRDDLETLKLRIDELQHNCPDVNGLAVPTASEDSSIAESTNSNNFDKASRNPITTPDGGPVSQGPSSHPSESKGLRPRGRPPIPHELLQQARKLLADGASHVDIARLLNGGLEPTIGQIKSVSKVLKYPRKQQPDQR